jgi:hypothetical protein
MIALVHRAMTHSLSGPPLGSGGGLMVFMSATIAFLLVLPVTSLCLLLDASREARMLRRDLEEGRVLHFRGIVRATFDPGAAALSRARLVAPGATAELEVLAGSGRLMKVDRRPTRARLVVQITTVGGLGEDGAFANRWMRPVTLSTSARATAAGRRLTPEELGELGVYLGRARRSALVSSASVLIGVACFCFAAGATHHFGSVPWVVTVGRVLAVVFALCVLADATRLVPRALFALRLGEDAKLGELRTFVVPSSALPDASVRPTATVDALVTSRLPWAHAGRPVHWRRASWAKPQRF